MPSAIENNPGFDLFPYSTKLSFERSVKTVIFQ
jgi:hypothetical protein